MIIIFTQQLYSALEDVLLHEDLLELYTKILHDFEAIYIPEFEAYEVKNKTAALR